MSDTDRLPEPVSMNSVVKSKLQLYDYFVRAFKDVGFPALVAGALWWQGVSWQAKMTEAFNGLQKAVIELTDAIKKGK